LIFLKFVLVFLFNLFIGYIIAFTLKLVLFLPRKEVVIKGKKLPFTPGFLYRKKVWIMSKINNYIDDYYLSVRDLSDNSRISVWEKKFYHKAWDKLCFIDNWTLIPEKIRQHLRHVLSLVFFELARQFLRSFVPYVIEKYSIRGYVKKISDFIDIDILLDYFNKYVYRWYLIFNLIVFSIIGFLNALFFLIIV